MPAQNCHAPGPGPPPRRERPDLLRHKWNQVIRRGGRSTKGRPVDAARVARALADRDESYRVGRPAEARHLRLRRASAVRGAAALPRAQCRHEALLYSGWAEFVTGTVP